MSLNPNDLAALDEDAREYFHERAAIYEYLGGHSRSEAEKMAWDAVMRYLKHRRVGDESCGND